MTFCHLGGDPKNQFPTGRKFKKYIGQNVPVLSKFFTFSLDFWPFHARLEAGGLAWSKIAQKEEAAESGRRKAESGRQKAEGGRRKAVGRRQKAAQAPAGPGWIAGDLASGVVRGELASACPN